MASFRQVVVSLRLFIIETFSLLHKALSQTCVQGLRPLALTFKRHRVVRRQVIWEIFAGSPGSSIHCLVNQTPTGGAFPSLLKFVKRLGGTGKTFLARKDFASFLCRISLLGAL